MISVVVFLFSFGGFLAAWSGYFVPAGPDDYGNTILFTLLANSKGATTPTVSFYRLSPLLKRPYFHAIKIEGMTN